jgi:hypothetical protein
MLPPRKPINYQVGEVWQCQMAIMKSIVYAEGNKIDNVANRRLQVGIIDLHKVETIFN